MKPPVLITGCARSGTSMVCGVLHASGLDFGGPLYMKRRSYQPRGYWEHRTVREKVLKPLLVRLKADPRGQDPLPPRVIRPGEREVARFRRKVRRALGGAEAYKDAKILLTWEYWRRSFPYARWVLVRRETDAIVRSCLRAPFMKRRRTRADWTAWVEEHRQRMSDLRRSGADILEIWPDASRPYTFRDLVMELGLEYDEERVKAALVPKAWHS